MNLSLFQRLARRTRTLPNGCIVFTGYIDKQGYARIWVPEAKEKQLVHRVAYELFIGPIPEGLQVDHLCFTRHCVNPRHLEAVTPMVNTMRSQSPSRLNADKTHCDHGHRFTPENTRIDPRRGGRICRRCDADRQEAYRARDRVRALERQRAWYTAHKDELNARRRAKRAA